MLIYALDPETFDRVAVFEEYESCIWTQRFIESGDFTLVVPQIHPNTKYLKGGVILENEDAIDSPMIIEGLEAQDGTVTCTGRSLETFFENAHFTFSNIADPDNENPDYPRPHDEGNPWKIYDEPGWVLAGFAYRMMNGAATDYTVIGTFKYGLLTVDAFSQASGDSVEGRVKDGENGHEMLVRLAKRFNVDMYVRRVVNLDSDGDPYFPDSGHYIFAFGTRNPVDRTSNNADDNPMVRFSPDDENLLNIHEVYDAKADIAAVCASMPKHFVANDPGGTFYGLFGLAGYPLKITYGRNSDGDEDFVDSIDDLNLPAFESRIKYVNSDKLTINYLKRQMYRYFDSWVTWADLLDSERAQLVVDETKRLAKAEYNKAKRTTKHVLDGEISNSVYRFEIDYKLGDRVDVASGLAALIPYGVNEKIVSEFIRSTDNTGHSEYPTLAPPSVPSPYDDNANEQNFPQYTTEDHSFNIKGVIPSGAYFTEPHRISIRHGENKEILYAYTTGPAIGSGYLHYLLNGVRFSNVPISLADGDLIAIEVDVTHSSDAADISGHFTIRVTK